MRLTAPHCEGHDPELWYQPADVMQAKAICAGCPERDECLTQALEVELADYLAALGDGRGTTLHVYGVFGGITAEGRKSILRDRIVTKTPRTLGVGHAQLAA